MKDDFKKFAEKWAKEQLEKDMKFYNIEIKQEELEKFCEFCLFGKL